MSFRLPNTLSPVLRSSSRGSFASLESLRLQKVSLAAENQALERSYSQLKKQRDKLVQESQQLWTHASSRVAQVFERASSGLSLVATYKRREATLCREIEEINRQGKARIDQLKAKSLQDKKRIDLLKAELALVEQQLEQVNKQLGKYPLSQFKQWACSGYLGSKGLPGWVINLLKR